MTHRPRGRHGDGDGRPDATRRSASPRSLGLASWCWLPRLLALVLLAGRRQRRATRCACSTSTCRRRGSPTSPSASPPLGSVLLPVEAHPSAAWDRSPAPRPRSACVFTGAHARRPGSIWGRPTWGVYWTWDARLTTHRAAVRALPRLPGAAPAAGRRRACAAAAGGHRRPARRSSTCRSSTTRSMVAHAAPGRPRSRRLNPDDRRHRCCSPCSSGSSSSPSSTSGCWSTASASAWLEDAARGPTASTRPSPSAGPRRRPPAPSAPDRRAPSARRSTSIEPRVRHRRLRRRRSVRRATPRRARRAGPAAGDAACRRGQAVDLTPPHRHRPPRPPGAAAPSPRLGAGARARRGARRHRRASSCSRASATRRCTSTTPTRRSRRQQSLGDKRFRLQGTVVPGTRRSDAGDDVDFTIAFNGVTVPVQLPAASRPSCSRPGIPVVLEGHWARTARLRQRPHPREAHRGVQGQGNPDRGRRHRRREPRR